MRSRVASPQVGSEARRIRNLFWVSPGEEVTFDEFKVIAPCVQAAQAERYACGGGGTASLVLRQQSCAFAADADAARQATQGQHTLGFVPRLSSGSPAPVKGGLRDD